MRRTFPREQFAESGFKGPVKIYGVPTIPDKNKLAYFEFEAVESSRPVILQIGKIRKLTVTYI